MTKTGGKYKKKPILRGSGLYHFLYTELDEMQHIRVSDLGWNGGLYIKYLSALIDKIDDIIIDDSWT